jgi:hypothetical protein
MTLVGFNIDCAPESKPGSFYPIDTIAMSFFVWRLSRRADRMSAPAEGKHTWTCNGCNRFNDDVIIGLTTKWKCTWDVLKHSLSEMSKDLEKDRRKKIEEFQFVIKFLVK